MPYVDKTEEFFKAVEQLSNDSFDFRKDRTVGQDTEVNELASKITDLLHRGNQKLQQLERCVRQKGIFNDKTSQIEELTYEVKQTITDATNDVDALVQYVCNLSISNPQGRTHLDNIIFSLKNRLFEFTKKFKDVLHIRSEHIKKQVNRRNMYSYTTTESTFSNDNYKFTPLRDIDIEGGQQQTLKMPERTSYLHSRADAMENIQKIIGDLAQMFQKVATMVTQQDEMIRRIDEDIDTSLYNTREGQNYLLTYFNRLTNTRTLILQCASHFETMENVEKIYIRNKAELSDNFFYFYNWVKLNFNTCLIISENSSLRSSVLLELLNGKKLVLSEINVCEALFRLACGGISGESSGGVSGEISDVSCHHRIDALYAEELKFFLKGRLASDKPVDEQFLERVEAEMALQKGFCKERLSFLDFLLFSIFKKAKVDQVEGNKYPHLGAWLSKNNFPIKEEDMNSFASTNFIQQIIEDDLKRKKHTCVITRFPPEPNGYLHLGHAKSICLNFGLSEKYGGRTHLRFDDTNPVTEEVRYIESIQEDVKWLGFDWNEHLYFASDYFDQLYEWAIQLIKQGDAYVDDQSIEQIRENRGSLKQPGVNSPFRERSVEENLTLFRKMKEGEFAEGERVLRAKIDMASGNINLRDPILYRIMHKVHPKSGDKWVIYPMYDFAHGQSDSIEKITHSICTLEFETHRPLYEWFQEKLGIYRTRQIEFARLNVTYMVMSKRKLLTLVNEKYVDGWDDPRMPTISGMRRRGYSPEAIKDFCAKVGVAKRENIISYELLELCAREDMNKKAKRLFAILKPLKVVITNFVPDNEELHELSALNHPKNESMGQRMMKFEEEIYIDEEDFLENPPEHFYRLAPNRTVRLRYAFCITCHEVVRDAATNRVVELRCTYDPESKSGVGSGGVSGVGGVSGTSAATPNQGCPESLRKVKSTIHWVAKSNAQSAQFRIYDKLFTKPNPESSNDDQEDVEKLMENYTTQLGKQDGCEEEEETSSPPVEQQSEADGNNLGWRKYINKNSLQIHQGIVEKYATTCNVGEAIQFERIGFFTKDRDSTEDCPVFNLTVALVENSALKKKKEDLVKKELDRLKREKATSERRLKREERKLREQRKLEQAAGGKADAGQVGAADVAAS